MSPGFTDPHAMSLVAPYLYPGEQILLRARGVEKPWYSRIFSTLGRPSWRYWLVVATNQRLVLVEHGSQVTGYAAKRANAFTWAELDRVALGWGLWNKALHVRTPTRVSRTIIIPRDWMRGNFEAAHGVVETWQAARNALPQGAPPLRHSSSSALPEERRPARSSTL
jgi:hypothetical protein